MQTSKNHTSILEVKNLKTQFFTEAGIVRAVDGIDLTVKRGEVLGVVGESGFVCLAQQTQFECRVEYRCVA